VARLSSIVQDEVSRPLEAHLLLQAALQRQGYLPPTDLVDGVYGPSTRAGIIAWQQAHNRQPTGTLSAADAHLLAPTVPETGSGGPDLRIVTPDPLYGVPEQSQSPADPRELKAEQERRETISRLDAEKARADADKAQADADRARAEAVIVVAKERAKAEAARKAAEQERSEIEAHGIQP
jgi:peptidoglycan hydrolase-like protein with peptidoglycan-binding domain